MTRASSEFSNHIRIASSRVSRPSWRSRTPNSGDTSMKLFRSGEVIITTLRVGKKSGGCKRSGNSDLTYRSIHLPVVEAVTTRFQYESPNPPIEGSKQSRIKTNQCHNGPGGRTASIGDNQQGSLQKLILSQSKKEETSEKLCKSLSICVGGCAADGGIHSNVNDSPTTEISPLMCTRGNSSMMSLRR